MNIPVGKRKLCPCGCHEAWGGNLHTGERCECNGGTGMDVDT